MARFSVGISDDGEGSSNQRLPKRLRVTIRDPEGREELPNEEEENFSQQRDGVNSEEETNCPRDDEDLETIFGTEDGNSLSRSCSLYGGLDHEDENDSIIFRRSYSRRLSSLSREGGRTASDGERRGMSSSSHPRLNWSSRLPSCPSNDGSQRDGRDPPVSVTLQDTEVLDCCICYEPLTIPIFQCENGHIACSTCCAKLRNKCPFCALPIGYNRCRGLEKVLESIRVSCPNIIYGCQENFVYGTKSAHLKICNFTPCSCPISACNYTGPSEKLYDHFSTNHRESGIGFTYGSTISVTLKRHERQVFLQEKDFHRLFAIQRFDETVVGMVAVSCFASLPGSGACLFSYSLVVKAEESCLRFESKVKSIQRLYYEPPVMGFVAIPVEFLGADGNINLDICIRRSFTPL